MPKTSTGSKLENRPILRYTELTDVNRHPVVIGHKIHRTGRYTKTLAHAYASARSHRIASEDLSAAHSTIRSPIPSNQGLHHHQQLQHAQLVTDRKNEI